MRARCDGLRAATTSGKAEGPRTRRTANTPNAPWHRCRSPSATFLHLILGPVHLDLLGEAHRRYQQGRPRPEGDPRNTARGHSASCRRRPRPHRQLAPAGTVSTQTAHDRRRGQARRRSRYRCLDLQAGARRETGSSVPGDPKQAPQQVGGSQEPLCQICSSRSVRSTCTLAGLHVIAWHQPGRAHPSAFRLGGQAAFSDDWRSRRGRREWPLPSARRGTPPGAHHQGSTIMRTSGDLRAQADQMALGR